MDKLVPIRIDAKIKSGKIQKTCRYVKLLKTNLPYLSMRYYADTIEEVSNKRFKICKALENADSILAQESHKIPTAKTHR